jgi:hypothetical protein
VPDELLERLEESSRRRLRVRLSLLESRRRLGGDRLLESLLE